MLQMKVTAEHIVSRCRLTCFSQTRLESPVHPVASRVKPTGQEQLTPTFTRPDGQPQPKPFPKVTWFPGHRGTRVGLEESLLREAAGGKMGLFGVFFKEAMNKSRETKDLNLQVGGVWLGDVTVRLTVMFSVT